MREPQHPALARYELSQDRDPDACFWAIALAPCGPHGLDPRAPFVARAIVPSHRAQMTKALAGDLLAFRAKEGPFACGRRCSSLSESRGHRASGYGQPRHGAC